MLTILLFPALVSLGFWQLDRAAQKRALAAQAAANHDAPPLELTGDAALHEPHLRGRAARATGHYLGPSVLLDNRFRHRQTGYEVLTPFELRDGTRILVARGWIAADPDRTRVPSVLTPTATETLQGRLGKAPVTGVRLGLDNNVERIGAGLIRIQRVDRDTLAAALGYAPPADIFYLDSAAPNGYDRDWPEPTTDVGKHQAYAVQWFAMAAVLLVLYFKINLQHVPRRDT